MKIYISYFYNIRFFSKNIIPISTAAFDPKWYHKNKGNNYIFQDDRGIINGIRCPKLSPLNLDHCDCSKECKGNPNTCDFLKDYEKYIYSLDFNKLIKLFNNYVKNSNCDSVCLMVYETPDNPCSERTVLKKWFKDNNTQLIEWEK